MKIPIGVLIRQESERASKWRKKNMKIYYKKEPSAQWKCVATNISEIKISERKMKIIFL